MSKQGQERWLSGKILVAETEMEDPNFARSLVLVIEHDGKGALGLVLNTGTGLSLLEACKSDMPGGLMVQPLFLGGPVEREYLLCLHSGFPGGERSPESVVLPGKIIFEPQFQLVSTCWDHYLHHEYAESFRIRFFSGYAGWSEGQLESEMASNAWVVMDAAPEFMFPAPGEDSWLAALSRIGGVHWLFARTGYKPSLN